MREIGGPTSSPGRPTAAPLTADTLLSMEMGARTETASGRRSCIWAPEVAAGNGNMERLHERGADAASRLQVTRKIEIGLETAPEDNLRCSR